MKHGSNIRRGGRPPRNNNGRRFQGHGHGHHRHHNFESSGPEVKIRGSAQQVLEKYLALARDAAASGDRISAENYLQHAEHYYRIINFDNANRPANGVQRPPQGGQPQHQGSSNPHQQAPMSGGSEGSPANGGYDESEPDYAADPHSTQGGGGDEGPGQR